MKDLWLQMLRIENLYLLSRWRWEDWMMLLYKMDSKNRKEV